MNIIDINTTKIIRPATYAEAAESLRAGIEGNFNIPDHGETVYVDVEVLEFEGTIKKLRDEAASAGDSDMVEICDTALVSDLDKGDVREAMAVVFEVLAAAEHAVEA